ncbi:DUF4268 domain-containing protein [Chloroflexota bacterium]
MNHTLGRLEPVDLRSVWGHEEHDFTPWLSGEGNLALLGDTIGLDLELDEREKAVGPFRADIVCKDTASNSWVLVENQIERTDHNHLGQLLTYAAGLDAVTIVWIADRFTDEHRAALDWLNEITGEEINFFGLEVELWRIGESDIAPKFNVVSKPNEWIKTVTASRKAQSGDLTPTQQLQLEYWTRFRALLQDSGSPLKPRKPRPQNWYNIAIGRSDFVISLVAKTRDKRVDVQLYLEGKHAKIHYALLEQRKDEIDAEFDNSLEWNQLPHKKASHITLRDYDMNPNTVDDWPRQQQWLKETTERFYTYFGPIVRALDIDNYQPNGIDNDLE